MKLLAELREELTEALAKANEKGRADLYNEKVRQLEEAGRLINTLARENADLTGQLARALGKKDRK